MQSSIGADNFSRLGGKAAKVLGKSEQVNNVHIYKMRSESMLGRQSSAKSLQIFDKDEESSSSTSSSRCSVSDDIDHSDSNNNPLFEMRKNSQSSLRDGEKSPNSTKHSRHMLVIPDTGIKDRVVEVKCKLGSSLHFMVDTVPTVCPSPDSGVHDNDYQSPTSTLRNGRRLVSFHLRSSSSPSLLNCDSSSNILRNNRCC